MSDEARIRLGCLELAVQLAKPTGDYSPNGVVEIATVLYNFTQASVAEETLPSTADKPKRKTLGLKHPDIMS